MEPVIRMGGGKCLPLVRGAVFGGRRSCAQPAHKAGPAIEDRQNGFPLFGIEADDAPGDAELLITGQRSDLVGCKRVQLFGIEADGDRT